MKKLTNAVLASILALLPLLASASSFESKTPEPRPVSAGAPVHQVSAKAPSTPVAGRVGIPSLAAPQVSQSPAAVDAAPAQSVSVSETLVSRSSTIFHPIKWLRRAVASFGRSAPSDVPSYEVAPGAAAQPVRGNLLRRAVRATVLAAAMVTNVATPALMIAQDDAAVLAQRSEIVRTEIRDGADAIVNAWSPQNHVIVAGDPRGVRKAVIEQIQASLKNTHFYVILVQNANSFQYKDDNGNMQYGINAMEYAQGHGIAHNPAFQNLKNPRTGQPDGVIFTIIFTPPQSRPDLHGWMWFTPSQAQMKQGLTAQAFQDEFISVPKDGLSRSDFAGAVIALRDYVQQRVDEGVQNEIDGAKSAVSQAEEAVKDLESVASGVSKASRKGANVGSLKERLNRAQGDLAAARFDKAEETASAVADEARSAAQTLRAYQASHDAATQILNSAWSEVASLEKDAAGIADGHSGDLAHPDVAALRAKLKAAQASLDSDPDAAKQGGQEAYGRASALRAEIAGYATFGDTLQGGYAKHDALTRLERASSAEEDLRQAKQLLDEAKELHKNATSGYKAKWDEASQKLNSAENAIAAADHRAAVARGINILLGILFCLGTLGLGLFLNRRAFAARAKARKLESDWEKELTAKDEAERQGFDDRMATWVGSIDRDKSRAGETLVLARDVRRAMGEMSLLWTAAKAKQVEARNLIEGGGFKNLFFTGNYEKATQILQGNVEFKPDTGLPEVFGATRTWKDDMYGSVRDRKEFNMTLDDVLKGYQAHALEVDKALTRLEKATLGLDAATKDLNLALKTIKEKSDLLGNAGASDGLFLLPSLMSVLSPAIAKTVAAMIETHKTNPIGAMELSGEDAKRMARDGQSLVEMIQNARLGSLGHIAQAEAKLKTAGYATQWIDDALKDFSGRAEALAAKAVPEDVSARVAALKSEMDAFATASAHTAELADQIGSLTKDGVEQGKVKISEARQLITEGLKISADKALAEHAHNPSDRLAKASGLLANARKSLDAGANAAAEVAIQHAQEQIHEAQEIVRVSKEALVHHEAVSQQRGAETARLEGLVHEHQAVLEKMIADYAASALKLGAGDPTHPQSDGDVSNNIQEVREHLDAAAKKLVSAGKAYREGELLEDARLMRQIAAHQHLASERFKEITEKKARLDATVASNQKRLDALNDNLSQFQAQVAADKRTMNPTITAFNAVKGQRDAASQQVKAKKGDPFRAEQALQAAEKAYAQVVVMGKNDADLYAHAGSSLKSTQQQLDAAKRQAGAAQGDNIADSDAIRQAYASIGSLETSYGQVLQLYAVAHGDWNDVDHKAAEIASGLARATSTLKSEMAEAQTAVERIDRAARKVREASGWSGGHGVYIQGSPGTGSLSNARGYLNQGRYQSAEQAADAAYSEAQRQIDWAVAEVARIVAEEEAERRRQQRLREEREEREAAARRSSDSGGGFGGGFSGSGGGVFSGGGSNTGGGGW